MASLPELIARIEQAPAGRSVAACFDYEGTVISRRGMHLHHEVWRLIETHERRGHTIVLTSSAGGVQATPLTEAIGAPHVIDSGDIGALAAAQGLDLDASFAYADGGEDLALLLSVGRPTAVEPDPALATEAQRRGWPELRCRHSGGRPAPLDVARTAALYGGLAGTGGVGVAISLLRRSRAGLMDTIGGRGSHIGLALAGVGVDVVSGGEHLRSARPCVFVFNHQSNLDPLIVMKLVRDDFTAVGKAEAKRIPLFGQLFQLAGVAFVERGNTEQAKAALEPAVAKVRDEGLSLMIAPEGTRSPTPRLGPFKKGAFHIAHQAGVPVVPIVIRNAGEIMWRGAQTLRPGRIEVAVLPPVATDGWTAATMGDHADAVRETFVATLANWPGDPPASPPIGGSRQRDARPAD